MALIKSQCAKKMTACAVEVPDRTKKLENLNLK